jgi:hypothetical protein
LVPTWDKKKSKFHILRGFPSEKKLKATGESKGFGFDIKLAEKKALKYRGNIFGTAHR